MILSKRFLWYHTTSARNITVKHRHVRRRKPLDTFSEGVIMPTTKSKLTTSDIADAINKDCQEYKYFWAIGLVKETVNLWRIPANYNLLNETARVFAGHYIAEGAK